MTRAQLMTTVRNLLGETDETFFTDAKVQEALYEAMIEMAKRTQAIRTVTTSTTSVAGTAEYAMPTNAVGFAKVCYDGDTYELDYTTADELSTDYASWRNDGNGTPSCWLLGDNTGKIRLYPTPDATGKVIKMYTFDIPDDFSGDSDTPDFPAAFQRGLAYYACYWLKMGDPDDSKRAAWYYSMWDKYVNDYMSFRANPTTSAQFIKTVPR